MRERVSEREREGRRNLRRKGNLPGDEEDGAAAGRGSIEMKESEPGGKARESV